MKIEKLDRHGLCLVLAIDDSDRVLGGGVFTDELNANAARTLLAATLIRYGVCFDDFDAPLCTSEPPTLEEFAQRLLDEEQQLFDHSRAIKAN